jgi:hypothetical protein
VSVSECEWVWVSVWVWVWCECDVSVGCQRECKCVRCVWDEYNRIRMISTLDILNIHWNWSQRIVDRWNKQSAVELWSHYPVHANRSAKWVTIYTNKGYITRDTPCSRGLAVEHLRYQTTNSNTASYECRLPSQGRQGDGVNPYAKGELIKAISKKCGVLRWASYILRKKELSIYITAPLQFLCTYF